MGMGFRLNLKWGLPIYSPSFINSSLGRCSSSVGGREATFDSARVSFLSIISEEGETSYRDPLKAYTCSSTALQTLENGYSDMEEMKMNVEKRSRISLHDIIRDAQLPIGEEKSIFLTNLQAGKESQFSLLMENLCTLEEMFDDSHMVLETDILVQLRRLGALNLFHACLSRTLKTTVDFPLPSTELFQELQKSGIGDDDVGKVFVCSGRKEERKSRRERALRKSDKTLALSLPAKTARKDTRRPTSVKRPSNSRSRRLVIAKNEVEMSRGVKVIVNLEKIRTSLEEETGRAASLSSWAEASGVDEKSLQRHLYFGWHCRDELLRSTRSLVVYLSRNYRGLGLAFEDLLQAGNLGVLQGAERFDHTRGYRFSTYVQYWIRKSMSTLVARHSRGIHIPMSLNRAVNQIQKTRKAIYKRTGRHPNDEEIAKLTGLSVAKIKSASKCLRVVGSIDQKIGDFLSVKFLELTPDTSIETPEETVMKLHARKDVYDLLQGLDQRERQVLALRYGLVDQQRKSLEEIGRIFHVSKEWIRKIEKKAFTKLRTEEIRVSLNHYLKS